MTLVDLININLAKHNTTGAYKVYKSTLNDDPSEICIRVEDSNGETMFSVLFNDKGEITDYL